jgi:exosome complex exonuclease RRP6
MEAQAAKRARAQPARLDKSFKTQDMLKPQLKFEIPPDNSSSSIFKPLLTEKPNAKVSLEESLKLITYSNGNQVYVFIIYTINHMLTISRYAHPYQLELDSLTCPSCLFSEAPPKAYLPYETTSAILVDTLDSLYDMVQHLKQASEIAIDLEHHQDRTFRGIVPLMQISTRDQDWVVDTLVPWRRKLEMLNEVFTDPSILKVFHGASMDIVWLQRDFGLYIVNLFDTYDAACVLDFRERSLKFLLSRFAGFDADKQFQMADWRIRPLPPQMFNYARSDTHFLLYCYDKLRNALIERSQLPETEINCTQVVFDRSRKTCLQLYVHENYDYERGSGPQGWANFLDKKIENFNEKQFAVFRALHKWRDETARKEDEGLSYVMPRFVLSNIASALPTDRSSFFRCAGYPSQVRQRADEVIKLIKRTKASIGDEPSKESLIALVKRRRSPGSSKANSPSPAGSKTIDSQKVINPIPNVFKTSLPSSLGTTDSSQLWGKTLAARSLQHPSIGNPSHMTIDLTVPLPSLTAEVFENSGNSPGLAAQQQKAPVPNLISMASHPYKPSKQPRLDNESFIARDKSRRRSGNTPERTSVPERTNIHTAESLSPVPDSPTTRDHGSYGKQKHSRKGSKPTLSTSETTSKPAFDYEKATPVLNSKPADRNGAKSKKKPFNPYAKAMDAPNGVKAPRQEPGKSGTWRN